MPIGRSAICRSAISCSAGTNGCSRTGASTTPPSAETAAPAPLVAVAYSGGRDSTALLHATLAAAEPLGLAVLALHVHHGLRAEADAWLAHCAGRCRRWARQGRPVSFHFLRLDTRPGRGESVEAWARKARYGALAQMARAHGAGLVLLAHHRRDQAETLLLQALRGGGVAGLAAMPRIAYRDGLAWARPWLAEPSEQVGAYARRHRLRGIEDDSNGDDTFARNRLRRRVWPALLDAFPDAEGALATAATWAQQASAAVEEQAGIDLRTVAGADAVLDIAAWRTLSTARQSQALRVWLRERTGAPVPASLVERLARELEFGSGQRWELGGGDLHSHRDRLHWVARRLDAGQARARTLQLDREGLYEVAGWHGSVRVERVERDGLALAVAQHLEVRARAPGDRFQAGAGRPPRRLKLQYQAAGLASWQRDGPVFCSEERLVFVSGLGIDARAIASPGEPQVLLHWLAHADRAPAAG